MPPVDQQPRRGKVRKKKTAAPARGPQGLPGKQGAAHKAQPPTLIHTVTHTVAAQPKYAPPASSRSDAAQRKGATRKRSPGTSDAAQRTNVSRTYPGRILRQKQARAIGHDVATAIGLAHYLGSALATEPHHDRETLHRLVAREEHRLNINPGSSRKITPAYLQNLRTLHAGPDDNLYRGGRKLSDNDPSNPMSKFFTAAKAAQRQAGDTGFVQSESQLGKVAAEHGGLLGRGLRDVIDLPSNTVTSTFEIGKTAATGHPGKAAKMLVDPIVQTVKHPGKSFSEHPVDTLLIGRGIKGAVGHGAGFVMRRVPVDSVRKVASTERAPRIHEVTLDSVRRKRRVRKGGPVHEPATKRDLRRAANEDVQAAKIGSKRVIRRQYSKDVLTKAGQVTLDSVRRKRRVRKGGPVHEPATKRDLRRAANEDVQAAKIVTQANQSDIASRALDAVAPKKGRGPRGRVRPSAAESLAAQGVTDGTRADLVRYKRELEREAAKRTKNGDLKLQGVRREQNAETRRLIDKALEKFDPNNVARAKAAYQQIAGELDAKVVGANLVEPEVAEATRVAAASRRVKIKTPEAKAANAARRTAVSAQKAAKRSLTRAEAKLTELRTNIQEVTAREGRARTPDERAQIEDAKAQVEMAKQAHALAKREAHLARSAHIRAERLQPGEEPAYVSHQALESRAPALPLDPVRPPVKVKRQGSAAKEGTLDAHPAKLVEQAVGTQRMVDAAHARARLFDDWALRPPGGDPVPFGNHAAAVKFANKHLEGKGWTPVRRDDGHWNLLPSEVVRQLDKHKQSVEVQSNLLRATGAQWRRNVLAFSPRWLAGNNVEGAVRTMIHEANPLAPVTAIHSHRVAGKVLAELERTDPAAATELRARAMGGGNYEAAYRLVEHNAISRDAKDLGSFANALHTFARLPVAKHLGMLYAKYTDIVFRSLNGRLETQYQQAMLGKALKDHPLMSDRLRKLAPKAVEEAARGLRDTATQAELGRLVDDAYGQYGKFSPGTRAAIANYTPFMAWTLNATNFLFHVLPRDHPVLTALLASANEATDDFRKSIGSYYDPLGKVQGQLPPYLQGAIKGDNGSHLRLARYLPFGLFDSGIEQGNPAEGFAGLLLPQWKEILDNFTAGTDWKGKNLSEHPSFPRNLVAAATTLIEGQVPLASQAASVTGVKLPNEADVKHRPGADSLGSRLRKTFDPFQYTPATKGRVRRKRSSSSANGVDWGDSSGGVTWDDSTSGVTWGG